MKPSDQGLYVHAIIPNYYPAEKFRELGNFNITFIPYEKISAIVSKNNVVDYKQLEAKALARLLVEHQKKIESMMNAGINTIIPMKLGTVVNDAAEMIKILEKGYDLIINVMENIGNLIEMEIIATWADFNQVLLDISANPQIIELKTKIGSGRKVTQSDQLSAGYLVKKILDVSAKEHTSRIIEALGSICKSYRQHEIVDDHMVCNTAFLLNQNKRDLFEMTLDKLDSEMNGKINFKLVGPLPCYSFYTLEVKELHYSEIEEAKKELGLSSLTSERNVKQAYLDKVKLVHPDRNGNNDSAAVFNKINRAYRTMLDYITAVKPTTRETQFSLMTEAVAENSFLLRIIE